MSRKGSLVWILVSAAVFVVPVFSRAPTPPSEDVPKTVKLLFVGDIMLSRQVGSIISREGPDFPFALMATRIREADIAFGNLENPVSDKGLDLGGVFSFRADPATLLGLSRAGFDIVSLANNHMFDWGEEAFVDTLTRIKENHLSFVGAGMSQQEAYTPALFVVGSETIAFLAYSEFAPERIPEAPAMASLDPQRVRDDIHRTKKSASVVVVSLHWGEEYKTESSSSQRFLAQSFIDAGATLVIGHHPHVVQEVERYGGGLIAFSLGNFVFDQNFSHDTRRGLMLEVEIDEGQIKSFREVYLGFTSQFQPFVL